MSIWDAASETVDRTDAPAGAREALRTFEIRSSRGLFDLDLGAIWRYRELLLNLIVRDLKILYRQAALGAAWAIIQPLLAVTIFTVVFGAFARIPSDGVPYAVFAFAAVLPWSYFAEAVRRSSTGIVQDAELVRKVYFPRLVMPLASVIAPLVDFVIAFFVFLIVLMLHGMTPTWHLIAVPPLILLTMLLALSVGIWLGPLNVRFRDIKHTVPFLILVWMYASPVIYPVSMIPDQWLWLFSLNPMVGIIDGFRWALLGHGQIEIQALFISGAMSVVLLLGGLVFFRRMERSFADTI